MKPSSACLAGLGASISLSLHRGRQARRALSFTARSQPCGVLSARHALAGPQRPRPLILTFFPSLFQ